MKIKNKIFGLTAMSAILVSSIYGSSMALARDCDHDRKCNSTSCHSTCNSSNSSFRDNDCFWRSRAFSPEFRHIAMNGDYSAWRNVMWRYGFLSTFSPVDEASFPRFIEAMRLWDCGEIGQARAIVRDLLRNRRAYNRGYEAGFKAGFVVGYNTGYSDGVHDSVCNDGIGRCDGYGIRY